jgi:transposase
VVFEQPAENLIAFFAGKADIVIYALNPAAVARYRETFVTSRAKDDPLDCALMADLIAHHAERFTPLAAGSPQLRQLSELVAARRALVNQRVDLTNQLQAVLKKTYPQALELAGEDLWRPIATAFLRRWPTFTVFSGTRPETLRRFYHTHGSRSEKRMAERLTIATTTAPLTTDQSLIQPAGLLVTSLVKMIEAVVAAIKRFESEIALVFCQCEDASLFADLPGAGPAFAPRLLCAFGDNRERFTHPTQIQRYSGIAPITRQSGKTRLVQRRRRCPKFLRQSFHEDAASSILYSAWANAFYRAQRARGKSHQTAVRALAYKWQRVLFHCWKHRIPYDESRHCENLNKHRSPHHPDLLEHVLQKTSTHA